MGFHPDFIPFKRFYALKSAVKFINYTYIYYTCIEQTTEDQGKVKIAFKTDLREPVYYTTDGSEPTKDSKHTLDEMVLDKPGTVKVCQFRPDGSQGRITSREICFHKELAKKVKYLLPYSEVHAGGGDYGLVDGIFNQWQGFEKNDADFVIDLGKETAVESIESRWRYDIGDWVLKPLAVTYEVSTDGVNYQKVHESTAVNEEGKYEKGTLEVKQPMKGASVRYIRVRAKNQGVNPTWHRNAGGASWIFVDEVVVK